MTRAAFPRAAPCLALWSAAALTGCMSFPHVTLSAPDQEAPVEQRIEAYNRLSPAPTMPGFVYAPDASLPRELELSGGERVYWAEDLLPVVPARSRTANAARKSASMRQSGVTLALVGSIIAGVGSALAVGSLIAFGARNADEVPKSVPLLVALGGGAALGGSITAFVGRSKIRKSLSEGSWAFGTYDEDVRAMLRLCRSGGELVDCTARPDAARH